MFGVLINNVHCSWLLTWVVMENFKGTVSFCMVQRTVELVIA
jgi:hypothetical protein